MDGGGKAGELAGGKGSGAPGRPARRRAGASRETGLHLGGRRRRSACDCPSRGSGSFRLMAKRPSDRRSPGRNPGPQGAFEVSMINVSCNSH